MGVKLGVNVEAEFEPLYIVPKDKKENCYLSLKKHSNGRRISAIIDEDREGESISWHLITQGNQKFRSGGWCFTKITKTLSSVSPEKTASTLITCSRPRNQVGGFVEARRLYPSSAARKKLPGAYQLSVQSVTKGLWRDPERQRRAFRTVVAIGSQSNISTGKTFVFAALTWLQLEY